MENPNTNATAATNGSAPATAPATESSRKRISKREYFDAAGEKSGGPAEGGKVVYTILNDDKTALQEFTRSGSMLEQFGFVTKVGNVANTVLNGETPGTREEAAAEIEAWLEDLDNGQWREPGQARAPKWNKDILAASLHEALGATAKGEVDHYRKRLDDKAFFGKVVNPVRPDVKAIYDRRLEESGVKVAAPREAAELDALA